MKTDGNLPPITKTDLDRYVVVGDKKRPLSQGTVTTDDDRKHRNRNSYGHDFAAPDGTPVYLTNGARMVGSYKGDGGTDHTIIELPDGRRYQFLHGLNA
jgi:murein DD-endopeptidase MepM/ murein hydrolase activator NlpD